MFLQSASSYIRPMVAQPAVLLAVLFTTIVLHSYISKRSLPPGPRGFPILGNILQTPLKFLHIRLAEWSKIYGPIYSLDLLGQRVVVLNTHKGVIDLLERRSTIYSDRPRLIMVNEIYTPGLILSTIGYGDVWRRHRRAVHDVFNIKATESFQTIQAQGAIQHVVRMLDRPESWDRHIEDFAGITVLRGVYGWSATANITTALEVMRDFFVRLGKAIEPGTHLVETIPIMKHLPTWMAPWKREALEYRKKYAEFFEGLYDDVNSRVHAGEAQQSIVAHCIDNQTSYGLTKADSAWLGATMFAAGAETTATTLQYFVLAMTLYPNVMRKAQAELDAVVGHDHPPTFTDISNLPYIQAIVKEVLRWCPVVPLALPHKATEDDWYEGYLIPKGAIVICNTWVLNRDPTFYPDFEEFRPERFLDDSDPAAGVNRYTHDMGHASYGYGRRICVGMHFANQALSIMVATILWAMDIKAKVGEDGTPMVPLLSDSIDKGTVISPAPVPCVITPRFPDARAILEATLPLL